MQHFEAWRCLVGCGRSGFSVGRRERLLTKQPSSPSYCYKSNGQLARFESFQSTRTQFDSWKLSFFFFFYCSLSSYMLIKHYTFLPKQQHVSIEHQGMLRVKQSGSTIQQFDANNNGQTSTVIWCLNFFVSFSNRFCSGNGRDFKQGLR